MIAKLIIEVLIGYANYKEHSLMILPNVEERDANTIFKINSFFLKPKISN